MTLDQRIDGDGATCAHCSCENTIAKRLHRLTIHVINAHAIAMIKRKLHIPLGLVIAGQRAIQNCVSLF